MNTRDLIFYSNDKTAQQPITGHLCLFPATKKRNSDPSKPPKPNTIQKGEARGLVAALSRARNQASPTLQNTSRGCRKGGE